MIKFLICIWTILGSPVTVYMVPEGRLYWTNVRPEDAKLCLPAAFTDTEGNVEGAYIIDGESYNSNNKWKVSISDNTFYISKDWVSNNGFQQLILVRTNNPNRFKDPKKFIRRALCKNKDNVFIIESNSRMTLTEFANICKDYCSDAVYLDMGVYGYGTIGNRPLCLWTYLWKDLQTNWICVE